MTQWPYVQLRRIAHFAYGDSLADEDRVDGAVAVYGSNGPVGQHDVANTLGPVLVVGRKGSFGKVQYSDRAVFAIDTTFYVDTTQSNADLRWLYYALSTLELDSLSEDVGVPGLSRDGAYRQRLPLPQIQEQRVIADYLDAETTRIYVRIEKKRRMMELLRGRLQVIVSNATQTSAMSNPSALPTDWRFVPLRRCFSSMNYGIGGASQPSGLVAVLGMGNVDAGQVVGDPGGYVDVVESELLLRPGDLLFNRTNSLALVGKVALWDGDNPTPTTFASYLVCLRTSGIAQSKYLNYFLNSVEVLQLARSMALPSIGQANLNPNRYSSMRVPLPPLEEQASIVDELDSASTRANETIERLNRQIHLLSEHRQALITAAVTGELDIPGVAA